jgi:hypothetical protein
MDRKDETILALHELVRELIAQLIKVRVDAGLRIKELEEKLKDKE